VDGFAGRALLRKTGSWPWSRRTARQRAGLSSQKGLAGPRDLFGEVFCSSLPEWQELGTTKRLGTAEGPPQLPHLASASRAIHTHLLYVLGAPASQGGPALLAEPRFCRSQEEVLVHRMPAFSRADRPSTHSVEQTPEPYQGAPTQAPQHELGHSSVWSGPHLEKLQRKRCSGQTEEDTPFLNLASYISDLRQGCAVSSRA